MNGVLCACGCGQENTTPTRVYHKGIGFVWDGPPRPFVGRHSRRVPSPFWKTREYRSYHSARTRCTNPKVHNWEDYGGRGIKFLFTSFEQFFAELGPRPEGTTIERINGDGNYEPGNVRWATVVEQLKNRRSYDTGAGGRVAGRISGRIVGPRTCHIRWHVKRGIVNPKCALCMAVSQ